MFLRKSKTISNDKKSFESGRRVINVMGYISLGGAEHRIIEDSVGLCKRGFEVTIVTLGIKDNEKMKYAVSQGVTVSIQPRNVLYPVNLFKLFRSKSPQAVDSHMGANSGFPLFVARLAGVPVRVAHSRNQGGLAPNVFSSAKFRQLLGSWLLKISATHVVGVTPEAARELAKSGLSSRMFSVPNAFDMGRMPPLTKSYPDGPFQIVNISRSSPVKNRPRLIEILASLQKFNKQYQLVLVGPMDPTEKLELQQLAQEMNVGEAVIYHGVEKEVLPLLLKCDVMLITSFFEGLSGSMVEACAMGVPVVSSDSGGAKMLSDIFADVQILDLNDSNELWAQKIDSMIDRDPRIIDERRVEAIERLNNSILNVDHHFDSLARIYSGEPVSDLRVMTT